MATYSVRCRVAACRHRRVTKLHPADAKQAYRCPSCKSLNGWRIEARNYNKKPMCTCGQSPLYPHRVGKYKFCDHHPQGFYNQAKRRGIPDDEIDPEHRPEAPDSPPF